MPRTGRCRICVPLAFGVVKEINLRPRRHEDLPALVDALARQQPASRYPVRWPLPFPAEDFIARAGEVAAFTAVESRDGKPEPVGHVSACRVELDDSSFEGDDITRLWMAGHSRPVDELGTVSALFLAPEAQHCGIGSRLLAAAVEALRTAGLAPCLDFTPSSSSAETLYRARGWRVVGGARPYWLPASWPDVQLMVLDEAETKQVASTFLLG